MYVFCNSMILLTHVQLVTTTNPQDCTLANCSLTVTAFVQQIVSAYKGLQSSNVCEWQPVLSGHCSNLKRPFSILTQVQHTCSPSHTCIICKFSQHSRSSIIQLMEENKEKKPQKTSIELHLLSFSFWQSATKNFCCSKNVSPVLHCSHKIFI